MGEQISQHNSINDRWVQDALLQTVRISHDSSRAVLPYRELPRVEIPRLAEEQFRIDTVVPSSAAQTTTDRVLSILLNSNIRRGNRALIEPYLPNFSQRIATAVILDDPVQIVLPTLPFKDQNPLTTRHTLDFVDLGEYLMFSRLRSLCASVHATYQPGVRITLLTDGLVYANIFAGQECEAIERYRQNCMRIRDQFGLRGQVEIIDLEWLVRNTPKFPEVQEHISYRLTQLQQTNSLVAEALTGLSRACLLNLPFPAYTYDQFRLLATQPFASLPPEVQQSCAAAALGYASFLLTMRQLQVIERAFPLAIRGTVHPKDAPQLPLHLVNQRSVVFPYNGVPLVFADSLARTKNFHRATQIKRFYQLFELDQVEAVYLPNQSEPFYYQVPAGS